MIADIVKIAVTKIKIYVKYNSFFIQIFQMLVIYLLLTAYIDKVKIHDLTNKEYVSTVKDFHKQSFDILKFVFNAPHKIDTVTIYIDSNNRKTR